MRCPGGVFTGLIVILKNIYCLGRYIYVQSLAENTAHYTNTLERHQYFYTIKQTMGTSLKMKDSTWATAKLTGAATLFIYLLQMEGAI